MCSTVERGLIAIRERGFDWLISLSSGNLKIMNSSLSVNWFDSNLIGRKPIKFLNIDQMTKKIRGKKRGKIKYDWIVQLKQMICSSKCRQNKGHRYSALLVLLSYLPHHKIRLRQICRREPLLINNYF